MRHQTRHTHRRLLPSSGKALACSSTCPSTQQCLRRKTAFCQAHTQALSPFFRLLSYLGQGKKPGAAAGAPAAAAASAGAAAAAAAGTVVMGCEGVVNAFVVSRCVLHCGLGLKILSRLTHLDIPTAAAAGADRLLAPWRWAETWKERGNWPACAAGDATEGWRV